MKQYLNEITLTQLAKLSSRLQNRSLIFKMCRLRQGLQRYFVEEISRGPDVQKIPADRASPTLSGEKNVARQIMREADAGPPGP